MRSLATLSFLGVLVLVLSHSDPLRAEVGDDVLEALTGKAVIAEKTDGTRVTGKLIKHGAATVVLEAEDGVVTSIPRAELARLRVVRPTVTDAPPSPPPPSAGVPTGAPTKASPSQVETANLLWRMGMGFTLGGIAGIILGGAFHGAASAQDSFGSSLPLAQAALAFYIIGALVAGAGIPMWAVGGVQRASLRAASRQAAVWDPVEQRVWRARHTPETAPAPSVFSYQFRF